MGSAERPATMFSRLDFQNTMIYISLGELGRRQHHLATRRIWGSRVLLLRGTKKEQRKSGR